MLKTVTVSRQVDGRSVCFSCANVPVQTVPSTGQETGLDLGLEAFATRCGDLLRWRPHLLARLLSPGSSRPAERARQTAPRRAARRTTGSARRKKAVVLLVTAHQRARRRRQDFPRQVARRLIHSHEVSSDADAQVRNRVQHHYRAKSISDAGWAAFWLSLATRRHAPVAQ
jgi:putative transposase